MLLATSARDASCDVSLRGDPAGFVDRAELPTSGQIHKELANGDFDAEAYDEARAARYARREGFY